MRRQDSPIFREEALRYTTNRQDGEVLQLTPVWSRWAYWMILAAFVAVAVYCAVGTLHEYATGPAVVWIHGRVEVTAPVAGTVDAIEIKSGQKVEPGQVLIRFSSPLELADLQRVDHEFDLQLAKSLRDPSDQAARAALTALRTQRDVAAARLERL